MTPCQTSRQLITAQVLVRILAQDKDSMSLCSHVKQMLPAAFSLAFFGFLRVTEFTVPPEKAFNHHTNLRLHQHGAGVTLFKTDKFSPWTNTSMSGVRWLKQYLRSWTQQHHKQPLFMFSNNKLLTQTQLSEAHAVPPPLSRSTHTSFQIGASTDVAQRGMPSVHNIQLLKVTVILRVHILPLL